MPNNCRVFKVNGSEGLCQRFYLAQKLFYLLNSYYFLKLFLKFLMFLQNASWDEHGPVSHRRGNSKGLDEHGVGLSDTARASCMSLG